VQKRLNEIGKGPVPENGTLERNTIAAIRSVQDHFMMVPDGIISLGGNTLKFLNAWKEKPVSPGVNLSLGKLKKGWDLVNPILPEGSYCSSAYRSADDQRRILHKFFKGKYRDDIIEVYGQDRYDEVSQDLLKNEASVLEMVRNVGQAIAAPGTSMHQRARAIDVGGPDHLDNEQKRIILMVARANPNILTGKVLKERNGCVHFEVYP
jgi:hypothetical protein